MAYDLTKPSDPSLAPGEAFPMNFDLSEDQVALRDGIRSLLKGKFPMSRVRDGFDRSTYESGQAWGLEGQPGADLLYGLTSPSFPVTVAFGDTTVSSDENGLWYTLAPHDLPGFTITTPNETINVDLVTSAETPQTTTVKATTVTIPP